MHHAYVPLEVTFLDERFAAELAVEVAATGGLARLILWNICRNPDFHGFLVFPGMQQPHVLPDETLAAITARESALGVHHDMAVEPRLIDVDFVADGTQELRFLFLLETSFGNVFGWTRLLHYRITRCHWFAGFHRHSGAVVGMSFHPGLRPQALAAGAGVAGAGRSLGFSLGQLVHFRLLRRNFSGALTQTIAPESCRTFCGKKKRFGHIFNGSGFSIKKAP